MKSYWPHRAEGLPPGQRILATMPRFSDNPFLPPPVMPSEPNLVVTQSTATAQSSPLGVLTATDLDEVGYADFVADFHCVTTWSVTGLTWTGVPLVRALAAIGIVHAPAPFLTFRSGDHRRATFMWQDAIADDVILATHLNGERLGGRHGGPLRVVAPRHYGYKSIKHVVTVDFRNEAPRGMGKEHLRAWVDREERHPSLPSWLVRYPYRLLVHPTAAIAARSLVRAGTHDGGRSTR